MIRLFIKGLVFGAGFTVAVIAIIYIAYQFKYSGSNRVIPNAAGEIQWHKLTNEQQIEKATVIAVVRYSKGEEGSMEAKFTEIYKDNPSVEFNYKLNDEYPSLKYYPKDNYGVRGGAVIFFEGSPAEYRHALYLYDERVASFGDMPLDLLIKKYKSTHNKSLKNGTREELRAP